MAAMLGSAIVCELVNKAASFLTGNYEMQAGVKEKLERLEELLIKIQSAAEAAEGREIKNSWLLRWLRRLKDAAYEADDVLDTFDYRILEQKANEDDDKVSSSFVSSSSNAAKRLRTAATSLFSCDEDVNELSSVVEKLERIAVDVGDFLKLLELEGSSKKPELFSNRRITSSLLPEEPFGRGKEKERIIDLLLQSESNAVGNVSVIPILGMGGIGKTTLAQLVSRDERVKQHFSLIIWVCVSDSFDEVRLTREMLEQSQSNCNPGDIENFNHLQLTLKEKLRSERFLLVLDDIWNENERNRWEKLRTPLLCAKEGSKIIVTTRLEKVAKLMSTTDPIRLQGLPEDEYWSFFKKCAFNNIVNPEEYPGLLVIGKKIANKLKGSPLAAKTLGALLSDNLNDEHWQNILKSDIWELEQGEDDIMPVLMLSYQHLPVHLQRCFAYCSVFPKDWKFDRKYLIYMWIAEGLIPNNNGKKRPEDIGEEYFGNLISKAFFQATYIFRNMDGQDTIKSCNIHDLLHDLAESVSKDFYSRIDDGEPREISKGVRHLSVMTSDLAGLTKYSSIFKHLRTLNFLFDHNFDLNVADLHEVLKMLKSIRVLNFVNCHLEALPISCDLIHLRYLNLRNNGIKVLPDELGRLYHLEMLILDDLELDRLPTSMNKLINLRHLIELQRNKWGFPRPRKDEPIVTTILDIGKLASLQKLEVFCVEKRRGFEIGQLKNLNELRGSLEIRNLESIGSKEEAMEARLSDKGSVGKLKLFWCDTQRNVRCEVEEEVLEGLQPHPHLKNLKLVGYNGVKFPSWLLGNHYLKNIVSLGLRDCRKWKELPPLGQFPSLKSLKLCGMNSIEEVSGGFFGSDVVEGFPLLEELELYRFPELKEWCAIEDRQLFPRLRRLSIRDCPKLMTFPSLSPLVTNLMIDGVGIIRLPAFRRPRCLSPASPSSSSLPSSSSFLSRLFIGNCPNLENFDEWSEQEREKLSHLESLYISCCPSVYLLPPSLERLNIFARSIEDVELSGCLQCDLSSLRSLMIISCAHITTLPSSDVLQRITKLSFLSIKSCGELRSIGGLGALVSLEYLEVSRCPKLTSLAADQVEQVVEEEVGLSKVSDNLHLWIDNPLLLKVLLSRERLTSLIELTIGDAKEITTFTSEMEEALQHLTSLHDLTFESCNSLQSLPACLKYLPLVSVRILRCPNIQSLPCKEVLPPSLKSLRVEKCHPALKERYRKGGPDLHTIAHVPCIHIR